ncbi:glycoside hydrolase 43 family protein [Pelagicoccus sp. NFK12]|uniref:Glycoside hydrolase 43 family protein n=1 Tax=Pelagicoccus enzymogenes TaxID=2773457 RepID=A0A927IG57_9BACT|nr:glycoside hydrolase 43 family protein [Pelagicoccus enzymogenes]MBD5778348.1 glycoside hydrolase 43 family protein [Pelagicoccus enzymogenes]
MSRFRIFTRLLVVIATSSLANLACAEQAKNPFIWADVPDVAVIRVNDTYYMSSTTMHMSPGLPIMKSKDLVNWELLGYAYDTLADNEALRLETERSAYGRGSWASSLRYHEGKFYVSTFSATSGRTHIYITDDIEKCEWEEISFEPSLHDHSLIFDDEKVYLMYGGGNIRLTELESDLSGVKENGFNEVVIEHAEKVATDNAMLHAEGTQVLKVDGMWYVMNICWPQGGMRTQIVHRSENLEGPYEGRMVLQDQGVAQGCLIDTPEGDWYAVLFQDNGAVGRSPWLVPVKWEDRWPVLGEDGKAPLVLDIEDDQEGFGNIVGSDEFNRKPGEELPLAWQWNHNPVNDKWSIGERKGHLRLETVRVDEDVLHARNMLTQRSFGPTSSGEIKLDVSDMKDGDTAGLIALQRHFGYVGVRQENGERSIVMVRAQEDETEVLATLPLSKKRVYLKIDFDFRDRIDKAYFYYSLNGRKWIPVGEPLQMRYTLPHFMGYRFGLFNWASEETGGYVDFDYYRLGTME